MADELFHSRTKNIDTVTHAVKSTATIGEQSATNITFFHTGHSEGPCEHNNVTHSCLNDINTMLIQPELQQKNKKLYLKRTLSTYLKSVYLNL